MDAASASLSRPRAGIAPDVSPRLTPLRLLAAVTILAIAVRAVGLGQRPLWLDEAYSAWFSSRGWYELWAVVPTYEPHPPFYYSLLKMWRGLFGGDAVALRGFSVALSVATVPLMIAAAKAHEQLAPSGRPLLRAAVAAGLAACSPMLILLDQEARPYPLLIFAYAVATLGLLRLLREFADGPGLWRSWALLAMGTETALWSHGLGALYALCLASALAPAWLKGASGQRLVRGAVCAALVGLLYLPCLLMMATRVGDWGTGWISWKPVMLLQLIGLYSVPYEALTAGSAVAALAMLLLIKRAVQSGAGGKGWSADRALLLLWWGPPLLAVAISVLLIPVFLPRTLAATLIPAYLMLAATIAHSASERERLALTAALCIVLPVTAVQVALREPTERWNDVAAFLARNVGPNDQVWLYPNDSALPLREAGALPNRHMRGVPGDYPATGFKGPIRAGSPAVVSLTAEQAEGIARDSSVAGVPTIWLVTRQSMLFDPANDVPRALARVRQPGSAEDWGYISVQPYSRRPR
jgi:uncharacterized membrane protein